MIRSPDAVEDSKSGDRPSLVEMHDVIKIALRVILNHVEPGCENCKSLVEQWLDKQIHDTNKNEEHNASIGN